MYESYNKSFLKPYKNSIKTFTLKFTCPQCIQDYKLYPTWIIFNMKETSSLDAINWVREKEHFYHEVLHKMKMNTQPRI